MKKKSRIDVSACFEIVTEEGFSIHFEMLTKKDEEEAKEKEFYKAETARVMKYTPDRVNDPKFERELKKKYQEILATKKDQIEQTNKENALAGLPLIKPETEEEIKIRRQRYCELIVGSLKAVVDEVRSSKVFMGPDGVPQRRMNAKPVLKKVK